MTLTPEQQKALQAVATSSIKVSCTLNISLDVVEKFQQHVFKFINDNHALYTNKLLCFVLCDSSSGSSIINAKTVSKFVQKGQGMLFVDKEFKFINSDVSPTSLSACSAKLLIENKFGVFVTKGSYLFEILCGVSIHDFDALDGGINLPFKGTIISRQMDSFNLILDDHMRTCVDNEKGVTYWDNRQARILRSDEKYKTEWIFQNSLYYWLDNFLSDKLDIIAEPSGHGQDKHDIRVTTTDGRRFVIEVKWLGKNKNGTSYDQSRIDVGLQQLKIYLDNDPNFYGGYLVAYDARSKAKHDKESHWDDQFRHEMCEDPIILFLKSETPSKEAERIVKELKKNDSADK